MYNLAVGQTEPNLERIRPSRVMKAIRSKRAESEETSPASRMCRVYTLTAELRKIQAAAQKASVSGKQ